MKVMLIFGSLLPVFGVSSRPTSSAFLARGSVSAPEVLVSHVVPSAGGACFGPDCCVHVSRNEKGACELAATCEDADASMLRHLEVAVVCKSGAEFTHHSFGYGAEPQMRVTTPVTCTACYAPAKSDFAFARTTRHVKERHTVASALSQAVRAPAEGAGSGHALSQAVRAPAEDSDLDLSLSLPNDQENDPSPEAMRVMLRQAVAQAVPACPVASKGIFTVTASPCCHRPVQLMEVLTSQDACGTADGSPPDLCDASCFLALQVALSQNLTNENDSDDDAFCDAYGSIERSLTSLLNAVCARVDGETCATVLSSTALTAGPAVVEGFVGTHQDAIPDEDPTSNRTNTSLMSTAHRLRRTTQATAFSRALRVAGSIAFGVTRKRAHGDFNAALESLCTPCFDKAAGAGLGLLSSLVSAVEADVFDDSAVQEVIGQMRDSLPFETSASHRVGSADARAMQGLLEVAVNGVCSTTETGAYCLPIAVESVRENASLVVSSSGASTCGSRCGKLTAQLSLVAAAVQKDDSRSALFPADSDQLQQLSKGLIMVEGGCSKKPDNEYCIDEFWAYATGLGDLKSTVEMWAEGCMTASTEGECGTCQQVLESLDSFDCCRGTILENMLLLSSRHKALETWGFVDEGKARGLGPEEQLRAIRSTIGKWTSVCGRSSWADPCDGCSQQVALSMGMPEGVTSSELKKHQFQLENALRRDLAHNVNEPLHEIKVLEFREGDGKNVSMVFNVQGETCEQAGFAADAMRYRVRKNRVVFSHVPEVLSRIADPVDEVVEFVLDFKEGTKRADAMKKVRKHFAETLAVEPSSLKLTAGPDQNATGVQILGSLFGSGRVGVAKDLAAKLKNDKSALRRKFPGMLKSDVVVSVLPNEPTYGLANRTALEAFGPDMCVHISRSASNECVLTTRSCDLGLLAHFEMSFICELSSGAKEKHSYGRGGALGGTAGGVAFDKSEAFHTGIRCNTCLPPPPMALATKSWAAATALGAVLFLRML